MPDPSISHSGVPLGQESEGKDAKEQRVMPTPGMYQAQEHRTGKQKYRTC